MSKPKQVKIMSADDMKEALRKTFEALRSIKAKEEKEQVTEEKNELAALRAEPIKSIRKNHIINLEDGKKYKQLTPRTLAKFGLTPKEYRKKYGFPTRQPLSAKSLTAKRRKTAKALGLAERMLTARKGKERSPRLSWLKENSIETKKGITHLLLLLSLS